MDYSRFNLRRWILRFGTTSLGRRLVLLPCKRIRPVNYCTSFRQRERTLFRQLIFWPTWLWSPQSSLRMLTYHLGSLSNPVTPKINIVFRLQKYNIFSIQPSFSQKNYLILHNIFKNIVFLYYNNVHKHETNINYYNQSDASNSLNMGSVWHDR